MSRKTYKCSLSHVCEVITDKNGTSESAQCLSRARGDFDPNRFYVFFAKTVFSRPRIAIDKTGSSHS